MFELFKNRFGVPGLIAVVALVFAMLGGAYAASDSGGDGAAASAKGKKGKKGKKGPRGPKGTKGDTGAAGAAGPAGPMGPMGPGGSAGDKGDKGDPGDPGQSVTLTDLPLGQCENGEGGVELSVGSSNAEVCNGEEGPEGPKGDKGDPWTPDDTLPSGATLTGTFAVKWTEGTEVFYTADISFPVKLSEELDGSKVHPIAENGQELVIIGGVPQFIDSVHCQGSVSDPIAPSGHLCVYVGDILSWGALGPVDALAPLIQKPTSLGFTATSGASTSGATLFFVANGTNPGGAVGSYAVTG